MDHETKLFTQKKERAHQRPFHSERMSRAKVNPLGQGEEIDNNPPPLCGGATLTGWGVFLGTINKSHNHLHTQVRGGEIN